MAYFWLMMGVIACATSIIWIKLCTVDPILLTGLRLVIAASVLSPFAFMDWRKHRAEMTWGHLRDSAIPGIVLAAHFMTWIIGARLTLAANGSLIVNLTPIVTPFLLILLIRERITKREIQATLLAMLGLAILFLADYQLTPEHLLGDLICFGSMTLFAVYLTLGRKFRHHPTNWLYVVPLYWVAGLFALGIAAFYSDTTDLDWQAEAPWVLAIVILPTIIGHTSLMYAMRHLRGQVVSIVNMSQFVFAGLIAWFWLDEVPNAAFLPAVLLLITAGIWATREPASETEEPTAKVAAAD